MARANIAAQKLICLLLMLSCLAPMLGCVGLVANLLNAVGAGLMPAAYSGLEDKKVAVICVSNSEMFGPTSTSTELARLINSRLRKNVKDIQLIPTQQVEDWIDRNDWDMVDFVTIGRGLSADMVVAIDLDSFTLHEGKTLYKGRADVHMVVYDTVTGEEVFAKSPPQIAYPTNAGVFREDISQKEFRRQFLEALADRLGRNFYAFDINEDVAGDARTISQF